MTAPLGDFVAGAVAEDVPVPTPVRVAMAEAEAVDVEVLVGALPVTST